jgi:diguanylate cyclase (GGDEF)-like protein
MLTQCRSVRDAGGRVVRLVGSMTDVSDRRLLEDRLRHDAHHDTLTGLPNRTLLLDRLERAIARARREPGYRFAVVFLDLDNFKVVNDSLGHDAGDDVLVQVAKRLVTHCRGSDTVSRFGGDEFVLLLDDLGDVEGLPAAVRRLMVKVAEPLTLAEHTRGVSLAAGVTVNTDQYRCGEEYVRDADTAMYQAKALGPGNMAMFDTAMHARAMARLHLESDLNQALAQGHLELHYQPILRLDQRRAVGLEALIRWRHPERGLVPPGQFLPLAEKTGQARPIGVWTIWEACRQLRDWLDERPERDDFTVSINLSDRQFWDPQLRPTLSQALATHRIPPRRLVLEVTEGVVMHHESDAVSLMHQLRDDGFKLHIDDFGTGFSSLSALDTLPVDALKIDRSFVNRMRTNARSRELVRLMVLMGKRFGVSAIAEGIETEEEAATLAELGCPLVQGYLFGRPVPAAEALQFFPPDPGPVTEPRPTTE